MPRTAENNAQLRSRGATKKGLITSTGECGTDSSAAARKRSVGGNVGLAHVSNRSLARIASQTTSPAAEQYSGSSAASPQTHKPSGLALASAPRICDEWTTPIGRAERACQQPALDAPIRTASVAVPLELPDCSLAPYWNGPTLFVASNFGVLLHRC